MTVSENLVNRLRPMLARPLEGIRMQLSRSNVAARCAALLSNQLNGIVALHLGHDIDHTTNGEVWIMDQVAPGAATFIDIGANKGEWTALFLARCKGSARGVLFEPSESAYEHLHARFSRQPGIQVVRAAVSDRVGSVSFHEEPNLGETSSLVPGFSRPGATVKTVDSITVDDAIERHRLETVDYLKIDAEGYDLHVLRGSERSLREHRVRFLQFEYNDAWRSAGSTLRDALDLLDRAGYAAFLLKGPGLYELPYSVYREYYHYSNFAAFPRERLPEFRALIRGAV
jgi:FkbM family methyltransferase